MTVYAMENTNGWSVTPCPGCGECPAPGEARLTVSGQWLPWHVDCYACEKHDREPHDRSCLL